MTRLMPSGEGHTRHAALAGKHELRAVRFHHPPDQRLVGAEAVQRRGVEQRHSRIQRVQQQTFGRLGRRWRAVGMAQVHAAQPDGRDLEGADLSLLHPLRRARLQALAANCRSSLSSTR